MATALVTNFDIVPCPCSNAHDLSQLPFRQVQNDAVNFPPRLNLACEAAVVQAVGRGRLEGCPLQGLYGRQQRLKVSMHIDVAGGAVTDTAAARHDTLDVVLDGAIHRTPTLGDRDLSPRSIDGHKTDPHRWPLVHSATLRCSALPVNAKRTNFDARRADRHSPRISRLAPRAHEPLQAANARATPER